MTGAYDHLITIFSPEGKLYQVEYAHKAIRSENLTSIAIRGKDCVVAVSEKKVPDRLIEPDTVKHIFTITPHIACLCTGIQGDSRMLVYKAREKAAKYRFKNGVEIPVSYLANLMAGETQFFTQYAYGRGYGTCLIFFSVDDEEGPQVHKVDPSGYTAGYYAATAGTKEVETMAFLEKTLKLPERGRNNSVKDSLRLCLQAMQGAISRELQGTDLEVCIATRDDTCEDGFGKLQFMSAQDIDNELTEMVESGGLTEYLASRQEMDREDTN
ncbi:putative Proteasome subunit alpha type-6 [Blattamonas nauphoetae]|uniref:Proteasome subunit alpha type n=1 Tax=Blattamonas nauphoetae TaxID=2049346 RepID=A0ABQ9Y140_9EUKA|nr:putative Proteasome subunit alpha type-6 [Blattamonas nauphoetae]